MTGMCTAFVLSQPVLSSSPHLLAVNLGNKLVALLHEHDLSALLERDIVKLLPELVQGRRLATLEAESAQAADTGEELSSET